MTTTTGDGVSPTTESRFERLDALFGSFVRGGYDEFLKGCADDLVLNVRGSAQLATTVVKSQLSEWHQSTQQLAGDAFRSSVCFVLVTEGAGIVVLTHVIDRNGLSFRYETVNRCTLRDELLASWFSYPMDAAAYTEAWGLRSPADALLAS
jgi:ketosteroid isomerase-like protein